VSLSDATFSRLQAHAVPLVDTIETVVNRILDAYEAAGPEPIDETLPAIRRFDAVSPPNLAHTKLLSAELCGRPLPPSETYWNSLLLAAVREARKHVNSAEEVRNLVIVNSVAGRKEEGGYKYLEDVGLSVQGQDANAAWKAVHHLARKLGFSVSATFVWYENKKAVFPGVAGRLSVPPSPSEATVGPSHSRRPIDMSKVKAVIERAAARPVLDQRSSDEIIGYDEFGLPR
jgi:hypothetical protein